MTEIKKKEKEKAKCVYVVPRTESYTTEACAILAGTTEFSGTHDDGELEGTITDAKKFSVSFSDLWED